MKNCPKCGKEMSNVSRKCKECKTQFSMTRCPYCKTNLLEVKDLTDKVEKKDEKPLLCLKCGRKFCIRSVKTEIKPENPEMIDSILKIKEQIYNVYYYNEFVYKDDATIEDLEKAWEKIEEKNKKMKEEDRQTEMYRFIPRNKPLEADVPGAPTAKWKKYLEENRNNPESKWYLPSEIKQSIFDKVYEIFRAAKAKWAKRSGIPKPKGKKNPAKSINFQHQSFKFERYLGEDKRYHGRYKAPYGLGTLHIIEGSDAFPYGCTGNDQIRFINNTFTLSKRNKKYYLSVSYRKEIKYKKYIPKFFIGVDLGIKEDNKIVYELNGKIYKYGNPKLEKENKKLKYIQRSIDEIKEKNKNKKKWPSEDQKRSDKLKESLNIQYNKITKIREQWVYHVVRGLHKKAERFQAGICIENLCVKDMMAKKNKKGEKRKTKGEKWQNAALGKTKQIIKNFNVETPVPLIIADKYFASSKKCSECGYKNENLGLDETWICPKCGYEHDRDINASRNLKLHGEEKYKKYGLECVHFS